PDANASTHAADGEYAYEDYEDEVAPRRSYRPLIKSLVAAAVVVALAGIGVWQWPNMLALYRSFRAPAVETEREAPPPPAATTRPQITDRIEPASAPRGRAHVQAAVGRPRRRHLQRVRYPDEAGRADARGPARRPRGQGHARLLSDRPVERCGRQGPQHPIAQGTELVRHPGRLH